MARALLYICVRPQQDAADGEYASFRAAMGLEAQGLETQPAGTPHLARHDLVRAPLPADLYDRYAGVVVGGSPFNLTDAESEKSPAQRRVESELEEIAQAAAESRIGALFTCYGIGVVTRMLGTPVTTDFPEDTGPTRIDLTNNAHDDPLMSTLAPSFLAFTAHKEGSAAVPAGAVALATNTTCPVQAYRVGDSLYATQFHPEPTPLAFTERMTIYRNGGYFNASDYDAVAARVLAASVTEPPRLLYNFARAFGAQAAPN